MNKLERLHRENADLRAQRAKLQQDNTRMRAVLKALTAVPTPCPKCNGPVTLKAVELVRVLCDEPIESVEHDGALEDAAVLCEKVASAGESVDDDCAGALRDVARRIRELKRNVHGIP